MRHLNSKRVHYALKQLLLLTFILACHTSVGRAEETYSYWLPIIQRARPAIGNGVAHDFVAEPRAKQAQLLAAMQDAGIRSIRLPLRWTIIEPQQDDFRWAKTDRAIELLHANNIDIIGVLTWVPTWANGQSSANTPSGHFPEAYPPYSVADFTNFVNAVASRYRGKVQSYEIFNEPNSDLFWRPAANVSEYIPFLCDGYAAIKAVDSNAIVGMGGLVGNGIDFIRQQRDLDDYLPALYAQGAQNCFDIVTIHPYVHPVEVGLNSLQTLFIDKTLAVMIANGDGDKPIWITEIGWSTAPNAWGQPTVSEAEIATWIGQLYGKLHSVERIYWYNLRDVGNNPNSVELNFGLLRHDLTPKPAFYTYKQLANPTR
ncbi:MAG: cellulase family glycosylhydrolase [Candidatus Promineifilaceae bacterium]